MKLNYPRTEVGDYKISLPYNPPVQLFLHQMNDSMLILRHRGIVFSYVSSILVTIYMCKRNGDRERNHVVH